MYTLDTNAIIYYVKDDPQAVPVLRDIFAKGVPVYISTITEIELFSHPQLKLTDQEANLIEQTILTLNIVSLDSRIARTAAYLRQNFNLKLADSAIAATALFTNSALVTRNIADFKKVSNLKLLQL